MERFFHKLIVKDRLGVSRTSKFEHKQRIKKILSIIDTELRVCNFKFDSIVIKSSNSVEDNPFRLIFSTDAILDAEVVSNFLPSDEVDIDKCLYFKDKITMADHKYHAFKNGMELKKQMASLKAIRKRKVEISSFIEINEFSSGFYLNPKKMIKFRITKFFKDMSNETLHLNKKIRIKLSCDGTQLSRNVSIVNFVFSIINEGKKAATASGNYRIGAFRILKESYETIYNWLPHLWDQIKIFKEFKYIKTDNTILEGSEYDEFRERSEFDQQNVYTFEIEYLFSADYKMILIVLGLNSASSNNPCFLCEFTKTDQNGLNGIGI